MRHSHRLFLLAITAACMPVSSSVYAEDGDALTKARASYYGGKYRGLTAYQCNLAPNWDVVLQDLKKANPAQAQSAIDKLKQLAFTVKAGPDVATQVTHNTLAAANDKQAQGLQQIYSGIEQEISGFFATYAAFMFTRPIPEPGVAFDLKPDGEKWKLTFKDGEADVAETLSKDFAVEEMRVKSPAFDVTIKPSLVKSNDSFVLAGYDATFQNGNSAEKTDLHVKIEHQSVAGFEMPKTLGIDGTYGTGKFNSEVAFTNCQILK